jgi:hypothetical protein
MILFVFVQAVAILFGALGPASFFPASPATAGKVICAPPCVFH